MKPLVAIIGRSNVGKSTLFNRLVGKRQAITSEVPGTTRDRLYANVDSFILADTAGLSLVESIEGQKAETILNKDIQKQVAIALESADIIMLMFDYKSGITAADQKAAELVHRSGKKTIVVVNKCDPPITSGKYNLQEFYELGFSDIVLISALHGTKTGDLFEKILSLFNEFPLSPEAVGSGVTIIGRPNVGKSTLFNAL